MLLQFVHYAIHSLQQEEQVLQSVVFHQVEYPLVLLFYVTTNNMFFVFFVLTGIMAVCATSSYYDISEIATRILPNVVVLTIDPDRSSL